MAAAIVRGKSIVVDGLDLSDPQGDKHLFKELKRLGIRLEMLRDSIRVAPSKLQGGIIAMDSIIDALPILAALGCYAQGPITLKNIAMARKKESNRPSAIAQSLRRMGAQIEEEENSLIIYPSRLRGAVVSSFADHRIAMSLSIAALNASSPTTIQGTECITKTYPDFYKTLEMDPQGFSYA